MEEEEGEASGSVTFIGVDTLLQSGGGGGGGETEEENTRADK